MSLPTGARLGPYEIVTPLGAGGMGEVYKARDTRLGRDVALKVLHAAVAADPESRTRFEREARTISQLNHPNICVLYDVGEEPGTPSPTLFLVMEFLEGESLAARLARGPIPPDEALDYAMQMADALDKAHRQGIVHRDLKPANVMLIKGAAARSAVTTTLPAASVAKLLDFGLAKLAPPPTVGSLETVLSPSAPSQVSPATAANPATAKGTILGTFQYMAPEQVEAGEVDARADIWAFGCVLYEMLTGRRAFEGRSQASMIASILQRDPTPVAELQPLTPPALGRVVRICLAKDPDARFQSAYDLLLQLQWIAEGGSAVGLPAPVIAHRRRRERTMWIAAAALTLAIGAAGAWWLKPAPPAPVVSNVIERFSFPLPEGQAFSRTGRRYLTISPDGKRMAYIADKKIYLREMHQLASLPIVGTEEDPLDLVFSPDGLWIAYFVPLGGSEFTLKKIQIGGGTPVPLCKTGWPYGASWRGGTIVFGQNSDTLHGIQAVPDTSGTPTTLVTVDKIQQVAQPHLLADGSPLLFTFRANANADWETADIVMQAPGEATHTVVVKGGTDGRVIAGDRLVYYKSGTVFAIGFDARTRATRGGAVPIVEGVQSATSGTGAGIFSVADTGTLVFVPGTSANEERARQLVWVDRQGKEEAIPAPTREYGQPRLSPDGKWIVVVVTNGTTSRLYTWELERRVFSELTPGGEHEDTSPLWTSDSQHVIYRSMTPDLTARIMRVDASAARAPEVLLDLGKTDPGNGHPESMSRDGKVLLFRQINDQQGADIMRLSLDGVEKGPRPLLAGPLNENAARLSPDNHLIAFTSGESGPLNQVYVRPYPDVTADRKQVSADVGSGDPVWDRNGRELFFLVSNKLKGVTVQPGPVIGRVTEILDNTPYLPVSRTGTNYDISLDSRRFLMIRRRPAEVETGSRAAITIVTHWIDELKARVK